MKIAPVAEVPGIGDRLLQIITVLLFVGAAVLLLGANGPVGRWWRARAAAQVHARTFTDALHEALSVGQVLRNSERGAISLVEFFDYECPYCRRIEDDVAQWQIENPEVRVIRVQYPLPNHPAGQRAALAAVCAKSYGDAERLHGALMATAGWLDSVATVDFAAMASAEDRQAFNHCMNLPSTAAVVDRGVEVGRVLGVGGTPTFVGVGGIVVGAGDMARLATIVGP